MTDDPGPCLRDWWAPRHDVPDSVDVLHMCTLGRGHEFGQSSIHRCVCGATHR